MPIFDSPNLMAPPTLDIAAIRQMSALDGLKLLSEQRRLGILHQFNLFHRTNKGQLLSPLVARMYSPINPILLATAISISCVRSEDFHGCLEQYIVGLDITGFEDALLFLDSFEHNAELHEILSLEAKYVESAKTLGTELLIQKGRLINESFVPTMLDVYWGAWIAVNPIFVTSPLLSPMDENAEAERFSASYASIDWSIRFNDAIHNAREQHEYQLDSINRDFNTVLQENLSADQKRQRLESIAVRQRVATLLVERSRTLYYWAPHEIEAYSVQTQVATELTSVIENEPQRLGDLASEVDVGGLKQMREKFLLPTEVLDQITARNELEPNDEAT